MCAAACCRGGGRVRHCVFLLGKRNKKKDDDRNNGGCRVMWMANQQKGCVNDTSRKSAINQHGSTVGVLGVPSAAPALDAALPAVNWIPTP
jgi:hypothetical protein